MSRRKRSRSSAKPSPPPKKVKPVPQPWWGWAFSFACLLIAVVAVSGQWLLGVIGIGAALTIHNIAGSAERTTQARVTACLGITAVSWAVFVLGSVLLAGR